MSNAVSSLTTREKEKDQLSLEQGKHLLRTKFYVPPIRSNQIARPRLIDLINGGLDRALILVSAPAGYGKTTLISRWLKETKIPSAWLSLAVCRRSKHLNNLESSMELKWLLIRTN